jgi:hypothetical protein
MYIDSLTSWIVEETNTSASCTALASTALRTETKGYRVLVVVRLAKQFVKGSVQNHGSKNK